MTQMSDEQLIAFALNELPVEHRAAVERAMAAEPKAAARLALVRQSLESLAAARADAADWRVSATQKAALRELFAPRPADWLQATADRVREWVAQRVTSLMPGTPLVAGFRSGAASSHLMYACEDVEIDIRLSADESNPSAGEVGVMGFVSSDQPARAVVATRLRDRAERNLSLATSGEFDGKLASGAYELRIQFEDRTVVIPRIDLTGATDEPDAG
ncbi:MAG: hypothetical protein SF069_18250 [Phycisphaerae bacterium]|nr:hypothetical protein [Phycisphaerae bacterium]